MKTPKLPFLFLLAGILASCAVGPDYRKPVVDTPPDWRWKKAEPQDATIKGDWWEVFHDGKLSAYEKLALGNNQELRAAIARVDQARARARVSGSEFLPTISAEPSASRSRTSANAPLPMDVKVPSMTQNSFSVPLDLSYEVDIWGRVRRSFESAQARAQATAADYQNVMLTLTADVAINYFKLRTLDSEIDTLQRTLALRAEAVDLQTKKYNAGLIAELDYVRAKSEYSTAQAELSDVQRQRAEIEAALALLCGQSASSFAAPQGMLTGLPPEIPIGLPSELLERRPDVASAERKLAARNAEIGVAYAAFFPAVRLTGQAGYLSVETDNLFNWDSAVWSFGPSVNLPIFTAGRNQAELKAARAAYEEAVANYRQEVLVSFKDVETSLSQLRFLGEQNRAALDSLESVRRASYLANERYRSGELGYLDVIEVERQLLAKERESSRILGMRMAATVRLIKSLGGGWGQ